MERSILGVSIDNTGLDHIRRLFYEGFIDLNDYERWANGNGVLVIHDTGVVYISNTMFQGIYDFIRERDLDLCYFSVSKYTGIHKSSENIFCVCEDIHGSMSYFSVAYSPVIPNSQASKDSKIVRDNLTLIDAFNLKDMLTSDEEFATRVGKRNEINLIEFPTGWFKNKRGSTSIDNFSVSMDSLGSHYVDTVGLADEGESEDDSEDCNSNDRFNAEELSHYDSTLLGESVDTDDLYGFYGDDDDLADEEESGEVEDDHDDN